MKIMNTSMVLLLTVFLLSMNVVQFNSIQEVEGRKDPMVGSSEGYPLLTHWGALPIGELANTIPGTSGQESSIWIVQFAGPIPTDMKRELEKKGVDVIYYLPEYAFIVDLMGQDPSVLDSMDGLSGISVLPHGMKVMPDLYRTFMDRRNIREIQGERSLVVELFKQDPDIDKELAAMGSWIEQASPTRFIIGLPITSLEELISLDPVSWVEPNYGMVLHNDIAMDIMGVTGTWNDHGLTGKGQIVTIADTGIDTGVDSHSTDGDMIADLDNRITPYAWAGPTAIDTHSHGTHVAGSVAGNGSLSNGTIKGMAPEADIFFQAIANESAGNPLQIPYNTSLLYKQAYDNGSRIHTNSWGSAVYGQYTTRSWDVDWFLYNHPEMIILYSAGNPGMDYYKPWGTYNPDGKIDEDSIGAPASAKNCITVGASENNRTTGGFQGTWYSAWGWKYTLDPVRSDTPSNDPRGLAAFSSRGPTDDGRLKPDIVAPGTNILSLRSTQTSSTGWGSYASNSNYIFMGGTSMSTPLTAGSVALIREHYNSSLGYDTPSGALMKATLINGATDLSPGQYGSSNATTQEISGRPDSDQGWGRVNISGSLYPDNGRLSFLDNISGISTGEKVASTLEVSSGSEELRLTLAWSDHPPSMSASKQLVNDLDLLIVAPNGTTYHGNDMLAPFNDSKDDTNPVEGISIGSPTPGIWKVYVNGSNVPLGPQHFALVASGDISNFSGVIELDSAYYSTEGDPIDIQIFDQDLIGKGTVHVNVTSNTFQIGRDVILEEIGSSGVFTGHILTSNVSTSNLSRIHVSHDDVVTVTYTDSDPSGSFHAKAIAKDPVKFDMIWKEKYSLVQAEGEILHLEGEMQRNITGWWMIQGISDQWRPLHDDGNSSFGDTISNDGNYSDIWAVPSDKDGNGTIITAMIDPFLGNRTYTHFDLMFNSTIPRYPKDLTATVSPVGNSVTLNWSNTTETDIRHYGIYVNSSSSLNGQPPSGWSHLTNTSSSGTEMDIDGLMDGVIYGFRVSAYDESNLESSPSAAVYATPEDTQPPQIDLLTIPHTIVGTAHLEFTGSRDLEFVDLEFYNDSNGNGLLDDGSWETAANGHPSTFIWDTTNSSGGPGNVDRMFLRYRGYDEVPNISDWIMQSGFRIDNEGPESVELTDHPARVTNIVSHQMAGITEPDGFVKIYLNEEMIDNATCNSLGGFFFEMNLTEGANKLLLSSYDQYGAGPTNRSYNFTLDTRAPVALMDVEEKNNITLEIRSEGYLLESVSYDRGEDPAFTYIDNITWTYREPDQLPVIVYSDPFVNLSFLTLGNHSLTLRVRDPAGNTNSTTLIISIVDTTPPNVSIDGPLSVDEKKPITYEVNYSDNDPRAFTRANFEIRWRVTGPEDFIYEGEFETFVIWYPGPGTFDLSLTVKDGGNNTNTTTVMVEVGDSTPPDVNIQGNTDVLLGMVETYYANVTDNDPNFPEGAEFHWNLTYLEGPQSNWWSEYFNGTSFDHNFTQSGSYTLILEAVDAAGNSRLFQINIDAEGDLNPPKIKEVLPAVNSSFQFSENVIFTIRFNEVMDGPTLDTDTVQLLGPEGIPVNISLEKKNVQGITEVRIDHAPLEFNTTYTLLVRKGVRDTWQNEMTDDFTANYTIRTLFRLLSPWGSELDDLFENFSSEEEIVLRFSNPVEPSSLMNYINVNAMLLEKDSLGNDKLSPISVPFVLERGESEFEVVLAADWDDGVEYNITIFDDAMDKYGYEIDHTYSWEFTTYIPPLSETEDDDDQKDDDPLPEWMDEPIYWILIAGGILLLIFMLILLGMIRRRRNLNKMWDGGQKRPPEAERAATPPPMEMVGEPTKKEEEPEIEPATASYEDLYGIYDEEQAAEEVPEPPPMTAEDTDFMMGGAPEPEYIPPDDLGEGIEWDEDTQEDDIAAEDDDWDIEEDEWETEEDDRETEEEKEEELEW